MNVWQAELVLIKNIQTLSHQDVVIRDIPGCGFELVNAGLFGKTNPDFRDQHTL